jgi:NarL family two-component system response regulator LiaR
VPTRVLLADGHPICRTGARAVLEADADLEIVGEAGDGREALELALQLRPDVLILESHLHHLDGPAVLRHVRERLPQVHAVFVSACTDADCIEEAFQSGASAYIGKNESLENLPAVILAAHGGMRFLRPAAVLEPPQRPAHEPAAEGFDLTRRQLEILPYIAQNWTSKQIGLHLGISSRTAEVHSSNLKRKLGARTHSELVRKAREYLEAQARDLPQADD